MLLSEVNDPDRYLGTPNDDRMVELFGDMFGSIHIGTGEVISGDRVTDLEFIRWRASVLGAKGQRVFKQKKSDLCTADLSVSVPKNARKCSNPNCPTESRYVKTSGEHWMKCGKICRCKGAFIIYPNEECKQMYEAHKVWAQFIKI